MKERNGKFSIDGVLALVLFGIFALCVLAVLLLGARAYQRLTERGQESYQERTAAQYIVTRVRQADNKGAVSLGSVGSVEALELTEYIDGTAYVTRVYCYDGYICELFSASTLEFQPADGERILSAQSVDFTLEDGLLTAEITGEDGKTVDVCVVMRSGRGAVYEK